MEKNFNIENSELYAQECAKMEKTIEIMESIIDSVLRKHTSGNVNSNVVKDIATELYKNGIGVESGGWKLSTE